MELSFGGIRPCRLDQELSVFVVGQRRRGIDCKRALIDGFGHRQVFGQRVKARQAQIGFDPFRIKFDRAIEFGEGLRLVVLGEEDAAHQDVTLDVIWIFLQDFFRQALGLANGRR